MREPKNKCLGILLTLSEEQNETEAECEGGMVEKGRQIER